MMERIEKLLAFMAKGAFEREEVLALSLLGAMAGESVFLLGLPGVGKSMVARRLKLAFKDAAVFEYLMSRFSTPDEIFGPVSISRLKDADRYERITTGYLPEAEVVFLDEIWKAGPAIQNSLLMVLNEKIFLNGNSEMHLPLKGVIAASNELPAEGEGLEALWDRFLIRYIVEPIENKDNFLALINPVAHTECYAINPIDDAEYNKIVNASAKVEINGIIADCLYDLRSKMANKVSEIDSDVEDRASVNMKYYVSDRRWKKIANLLRTSACLNGRKSVDYSDLLLLGHVLWNSDAEAAEIQEMVCEAIVGAAFKVFLKKYKSARRHAQKRKKSNIPDLFSADRVNYIIPIDEMPLKIRIIDYNKIAENPNEYFFASETNDGQLVLRDRGAYLIRFVKPGCITINGYNHNLLTESDNELSDDFIGEAGDSLEAISQQLMHSIHNNLFTRYSRYCPAIQHIVMRYKSRFEL